MDYRESRFYQENFNWYFATWRHGTQKAKRDISDWKIFKKYMKNFNSFSRNHTRVNIKSNLQKISINSEDEEIEDIYSRIFNLERQKAKWYYFD